MTVARSMRHTKANPCPICGGAEGDPRGKEKRCHGWTTTDGDYVHCTREEHAGSIEQGPDGCFAHRMHGPCKCGQIHSEAVSSARPANDNIERVYEYQDENGLRLFEVVRFLPVGDKKKFLQRRYVGEKVEWNLQGVRRVPYRLPQVLQSSPDRVVYVAEGEKDVETIERLGHVATCNPGGAEKWKYIASEAAKALRGRVVVVLADADEKGRRHAEEVRAALHGVAKSVRIVEPPAPHKDVTDYVVAGGDFAALVAEPQPESTFRIQWADALAQELKPIDWLCRGYTLPKGCYSMTAGESYSGKSLWITDLALAIASGGSAMGIHAATQGRVLWFDYDGQGERITRTRLQRMARSRKVNLAELRDQFGYVWLPDARLDDPDAYDKFARVLDGVAFAVIDSWRGAAPNTEEKDRGAVQKVAHTIFKLIEATGVTPMIVDHTIKPAREGKSTRSAMHDIHGSSAKAEAAQWVAIFEKQEGKPVTVKHTKERAGAQTMPPFALEYLDEEAEGDPRWGLRVRHLDLEQVMAPFLDQIDRCKEKVRMVLRNRRKTYETATDIYDATGGKKQNVLKAIGQMIDDHEITIQADGRHVLSGSRGTYNAS